VLVADQYLRAAVPDVIKFDFDFSWRRRVNANAINTGKEFVSNEDTQFKTEWEQREVAGVTAQEDQDRLEALCRVMRERLDPVVSREVDADTPEILLNRLDFGETKYLVVVNDHRTYDDRVGKFKAILGKGLPVEAALSWRGLSPETVLYDMVSGKQLDSSFDDEVCRCKINVPASGGMIIAAMPGSVSAPVVKCPEEIRCGAEKVIFKVELPGAAGIVPVEISITDSNGNENEFSGVFYVIDGVCEVEFSAALNDQPGEWFINAVSLLNHLSVENSFNVIK
jgi:hypothetical protein